MVLIKIKIIKRCLFKHHSEKLENLELTVSIILQLRRVKVGEGLKSYHPVE